MPALVRESEVNTSPASSLIPMQYVIDRPFWFAHARGAHGRRSLGTSLHAPESRTRVPWTYTAWPARGQPQTAGAAASSPDRRPWARAWPARARLRAARRAAAYGALP